MPFINQRPTAKLFIGVTLCVLLAIPAHAQQLAASYSAALPDDDAPRLAAEARAPDGEMDIDPKPLSLADLEKLDGYKKSNKAADNVAPPSPIETLYSNRADQTLALYGYDLFNAGVKPSGSIPAGMIPDSYILSTGDKLDIITRGQEVGRKTYEINSQGQLVTDNLSTIDAAGRSLTDVRKALEAEAQRLPNVEISVSVSTPRQIDVLVIGEVAKPGRKTMTAYHTVLDVLQEADGVRRSGSLRRIKLVRGGKSEFIDLYAVTMQGGAGADLTLRDGDRIIVPPLGPTVAVAGAVKRPAVYEIRPGEKLSTLEMLGMAGGVLAPGANRFMRLALGSDGRESVDDIAEPGAKLFGDGGLLDVAQAKEMRAGNVELSGHARDPGEHDLKKARTLSELLKSERSYKDRLYPLIGVIERRDDKSLTTTLVEFSPRAVMQGQGDSRLNEGDIVHLFSLGQIRKLGQSVSREPLLKHAAYRPGDDDKGDDIADGAIASFLAERSAFVRGAVRAPGAYPVSTGTTLETLVSVAGGATVEADRSYTELTIKTTDGDIAKGANRQKGSLDDRSFATASIAPGDTVRVAQKFNRVEEQSVTLMGEVRKPGKYDLLPGDTMSSVINRAGGLTDIAYPAGTIFSRASERKQEESRYQAEARDLELKLAESLKTEDKSKKPDPTQVSAAQGLIAQLKDAKAVGRITVAADPDTLAADPDQDILLEPADKIYIPRRPLTVRVGGEVLSPAALQFRKGKSAEDYIEEAGGTTYFADRDRAFVVYPDGSARPLEVSSWKSGVSMVPPGSTVIVPRDPKPYDFLESAGAVTGILANIALTGFYLDDLHDNDE